MQQDPLNDQNHLFPEAEDKKNFESGYTPVTAQEETPLINDSGDIPIGNQQITPQTPEQNVQTPQQPQNYQDFDSSGYGTQPQNTGFSIQQKAEDPVQKTSIKDKVPKFDFQKISAFFAAKWWLVLLCIIAVSVMGVGVSVFFNRLPAPQGLFNDLDAVIEAPQTSPSGSPSTWKLTLTNNESESLQNIVVSLNFDRTFQFIRAINPQPSKTDGSEFKIARLEPAGQSGSEVIIQFEGTLTGDLDEETLMSGSVTFTPTPVINNSDNRRSVDIPFATTKITQPQIQLSLIPSDSSIQNGGEVEFSVLFENTSERRLDNLRIRMEYPDRGGFSYTGSEIQVADTSKIQTTPDNGNNIWNIESLPRLAEQSLKVRGNVFGVDGIRITFVANIEAEIDNRFVTLATAARDVTIISQPLVISTSISNKDNDKLFDPGDTLQFVINYQNTSNVVLRDVEILASVDDPANILDYTTTTFTGGNRGTSISRTIQWRGTNVPKLASLSPQDGGQLSYSIRLKDVDAFLETNLPQNSFVITPKVSAKADNLQPVDFAGDLYKSTGLLNFDQSVEFKEVDPTNQNRETYTVTWTLTSNQTQINDVQVRSITGPTLRPNTWQQASILPVSEASKISYNQVTGEIIWNIGRLDAYTGINENEPLTISFDLVIEFDQETSRRRETLFTAPIVVGVDDFTGEAYELTGELGETR